MKIGIEEEFIVADPETLFTTPGTFRLANALVYNNNSYAHKCSVELPINSGSISTILSHISEAFCVFEIKTDVDSSSLQKGLGQLLLYTLSMTEKPALFLVLPENLDPVLEKKLKSKLNIEILVYKQENNSISFHELDSLLKNSK